MQIIILVLIATTTFGYNSTGFPKKKYTIYDAPGHVSVFGAIAFCKRRQEAIGVVNNAHDKRRLKNILHNELGQHLAWCEQTNNSAPITITTGTSRSLTGPAEPTPPPLQEQTNNSAPTRIAIETSSSLTEPTETTPSHLQSTTYNAKLNATSLHTTEIGATELHHIYTMEFTTEANSNIFQRTTNASIPFSPVLARFDSETIDKIRIFKNFSIIKNNTQLQIKTIKASENYGYSEAHPFSSFSESRLNRIKVFGLNETEELTIAAAQINGQSAYLQTLNNDSFTDVDNTNTSYFVIGNLPVLLILAFRRSANTSVSAAVSFSINTSSGAFPEEAFPSLPPSVFETQTVTESASFSCQFINESTGTLSNKGCKTGLSTIPGFTSCDCTHTTTFAILLQVKTYQIPYAVTIISFTTQTVSILFLIITLVILLKVRKKVKNDRTSVQINLTVSMLLLFVVTLFSTWAKRYNEFCEMVAVLTQFSLLASVSWMLVEGITLLLKTVAVMRRYERNKIRALRYGIGWGLPSLITIIAVIVGFTSPGGYIDKTNPSYYLSKEQNMNVNITFSKYRECWIGDTNFGLLIWSVLAPVGLIIFINTIILIRTGFLIYRISSEADNFKPTQERSVSSDFALDPQHLRATAGAVLLLLPVLGIPIFLGFISGPKASSIVGMYLTSIVNGLEGLFLFLLYCVKGSEVRQAIVQTWNQSRAQSMSHSGNESGFKYLKNHQTPSETPNEVIALRSHSTFQGKNKAKLT